jgi:hypothetical protein
VEIITTLNVDFGLGREDYIREALLGDYTSFSTQ